jgi:hypothetical protein
MRTECPSVIYLCTARTSNCAALRETAEKWWGELEPHLPRCHAKTRRHVRDLLKPASLCLKVAEWTERNVGFYLSRDFYADQKRKRKAFFTLAAVRALNAALVAAGLVEHVPGSFGKRLVSEWSLTEKGREWLSPLEDAEIGTEHDTIEMRDAEKQPLRFDHTARTWDWQMEQERFNALLALHNLDLVISEEQLRTLSEDEYYALIYTVPAFHNLLLRLHISPSTRLSLLSYLHSTTVSRTHLADLPAEGVQETLGFHTYSLPLATKLHRVFNLDFRHGGRFYAPYQSIPRALRPQFLLDSQPLTECDFTGMQLHQAYHLSDLEAPGHGYELFPHLPHGKKVVKYSTLKMLNDTDRDSAIASIQEAINRDGYYWAFKDDGWTGTRLVEFLEEAYSPIAHRFYCGFGMTLQYLESLVTFDVMQHFLGRAIPFLPLHDGNLIGEAHVAEMCEQMDRAYRHHHNGFRCEVARKLSRFARAQELVEVTAGGG